MKGFLNNLSNDGCVARVISLFVLLKIILLEQKGRNILKPMAFYMFPLLLPGPSRLA